MARLDVEGSLRHRKSNAVETVLLLAGVVTVFAVLSWLFFGPVGFAGTIILLGGFFVFGAPASGRLTLRLFNARPLPVESAPGLYDLLLRICRRAGLAECPTLFYIPDSSTINAFTTELGGGVGIALSDGILNQLTRREMAGVLAHEVAHALNGDLRIQALVQILGRVTAFLGNAFQLLLLLNLPLLITGRVVIPLWLLLAFAAGPAVLLWLQMRLSRVREFDADVTAVRITGDPEGLASALRRLGWLERQWWGIWGRIFGRAEPPKWLRTHPDTEERVARLAELTVPERFDWLGGGQLRWIARDLMERLRGL